MDAGLAGRIVEYVESSSGLIESLEKRADSAERRLAGLQLDDGLLEKTAVALAAAGIIDRASAAKAAGVMKSNHNEVLGCLHKLAAEKAAERQRKYPVLGKGVGASNQDGGRGAADRALLKRVGLGI